MSKDQVKARVEEVARKLLGIQTLRAQGMDRLDFHEVSVWGLEAALMEAYRLGQESAKTN